MAQVKIKKIIDTEGLFILMHKNIEVCRIEFIGDGKINSVNIFENAELHMPLGSNKDIHSFRVWWENRAIPKTRNNAKTALELLGYANTSVALINNLALSLNDCYWIKPIDTELKWENVNLYTNDFEDVFGDLTLIGRKKVSVVDKTIFNSATSPGELQKKWCIDKNNKRVLIKGNYGLSYQQSINEVFASSLHKAQSFKNYVNYTLTNLTLADGNKAIGCSSYCFCNEKVESISLSSIYLLEKQRNDESNYDHLRNMCIKVGIDPKEFDDYFDYLILSDFLLTNTDRHLNNISLLRDPDSLKILGFSPIYDSGNSMFYKVSTSDFDDVDVYHIKINSIDSEETKMLKHVKNKNAINLSRINLDFSIYDEDIQENLIRKEHYMELFNKKVELLKMFQNGIEIWKH